jgi:ATP-dependent Lon protease
MSHNDTQTKINKKDCSKILKPKTNTKQQKTIAKKKNESSDSDSCESETETTCSDEEDGGGMDKLEYHKILSKLFPSKHLNAKIQAGSRIKEIITTDKKKQLKEQIKKDDTPKSSTAKYNLRNKKNSNKPSTSKTVVSTESSDDSENDSDYETETSTSTSSSSKNKEKKIQVILHIGGSSNEYETCSESEEDINTEDENLSINTSSSEDDEVSSKPSQPPSKISKLTDKEKDCINADIFLQNLKSFKESNNHHKGVDKFINMYEEDLIKMEEKKTKRNKLRVDQNCKIYKKYTNSKTHFNDMSFFKNLELDKQKELIEEIRKVNDVARIEKPYKIAILESNISPILKNEAIKKINSLQDIDPGSGEYYKINNWVETFMRIPFGKYKELPVSIADGVDKCHDFIENAQQILNNAVYGLNDAKMQIMQMVGQLIANPKSIGTAIAIHGPPGSGKTSLVKEGISKILNRPFAFIALGGATDSSFLEGHSYTYEGSTWGKIVQILIESKCMNPVIYFDELDKISETPKGEEIAGILTHLTDTSQNSQFHDKYFSEVDFDLSKCLFIFSYNDESKVNPILKDRMYRIETKGYDKKQKLHISNNYLLPKIVTQLNFKVDDIKITEEAISYIIDNNCDKEPGVRNLKRCLEIIYTKLNLYRLMKPGSNIFQEDMSLKIDFPVKVEKDFVDKLIKRKDDNINIRNMYI